MIYLQPVVALVGAGVIGLCVGSFLNVVIHRMPLIMRRQYRQEAAEFLSQERDIPQPLMAPVWHLVKEDRPISLSFPPSRCPTCNHKISALENIPLISWLALGGKCKGCKSPIGIRYPLVELVTGLLSMLAIWLFGPGIAGILAMMYVWILIALTGIDFDTQLLPDRLVFPLGMLGLGASVWGVFVPPTHAIAGAILGYALLYLARAVGLLLFKKDGMGMGDLKLLAAIGTFVGADFLPLVVLISSILGAFVGIWLRIRAGESQPFAFGPYIAIAGIIALFFGNDIMSWYLG